MVSTPPLRSRHALGTALAGLVLCAGFTAATPHAAGHRTGLAAAPAPAPSTAPSSAAGVPTTSAAPSPADHGKVILAAARRTSYAVPAPGTPAAGSSAPARPAAGSPAGTGGTGGRQPSVPARRSATTKRASSGYDVSSYAYAVLSQLNAERRAHGRPALRMNGELITSAHRHNLAMAAADQMSHQVAGEAFFADRIQAAGYDYNWAGENVGWNSAISTSGALRLETMMYDEGPGGGHYDNIVSAHYTDVGIDVWVDTVHQKLWLTEDFGSR